MMSVTAFDTEPITAGLLGHLDRPGTVLLDAARGGHEAGCLLFTDPVEVLVARTLDEVVPLLDVVDRSVAVGRHVAGYLGYEAGHAFEPTTRRDVAGRLAWLGVYEAPLRLPSPDVEALLQQHQGTYALLHPAFTPARQAYLESIAAIKRHIHEGDVYQVNYTGHVAFRFAGDAVAFYRDLRQRQRVAYGAFVNTGTETLLSASPELFFEREGKNVTVRPMKGTVRRGRSADEDERLAAWLRDDAKSRAENLMIVDLLRNDLSIICEPGTVRTPALFSTEHYETVIQMTSTVTGTLREDVGYRDLFRALFPCGSVTGAPKIRAMQRIDALEDGPRGPYCGAIGFFAPDDRAVFNVAIRTVVLRDGAGTLGTGGGIVSDSEPGAEYEECLLKARFMTDLQVAPFSLIETMACEDGAIDLLEQHLARLRASAAFFGFRLDGAAVQTSIDEAVAAAGSGRCRVRLTLDADGAVAINTSPLPAAADPKPWRVTFAEAPVDCRDVFRYHKTTRRARHEDALSAARSEGYDEALFVNQHGHVTEGTRTNVFARFGNTWITPPVASGLLPGVYRRHLLETLPDAEERDLTVEQLLAADEVFVCNAVRGRRAAVLTRDA